MLNSFATSFKSSYFLSSFSIWKKKGSFSRIVSFSRLDLPRGYRLLRYLSRYLHSVKDVPHNHSYDFIVSKVEYDALSEVFAWLRRLRRPRLRRNGCRVLKLQQHLQLRGMGYGLRSSVKRRDPAPRGQREGLLGEPSPKFRDCFRFPLQLPLLVDFPLSHTNLGFHSSTRRINNVSVIYKRLYTFMTSDHLLRYSSSHFHT